VKGGGTYELQNHRPRQTTARPRRSATRLPISRRHHHHLKVQSCRPQKRWRGHRQMEAAVDSKTALYRGNVLVSKVAQGWKTSIAKRFSNAPTPDKYKRPPETGSLPTPLEKPWTKTELRAHSSTTLSNYEPAPLSVVYNLLLTIKDTYEANIFLLLGWCLLLPPVTSGGKVRYDAPLSEWDRFQGLADLRPRRLPDFENASSRWSRSSRRSALDAWPQIARSCVQRDFAG